MLLRLFGAKVGSNCIIKPGVKIKFPWKLEAGNWVSFGEMVWIDNLGLVKLGNNVTISQGAYLCTGNHDFRKVSFDLIVGEIILADGVWIGAHSCVGPGITMGISSILTMNSVLTTDTNDFGIYQGNPAKYVKKRTLEL
jgi:putative colanic acid biosynthesis acetyltransferase WcaF